MLDLHQDFSCGALKAVKPSGISRDQVLALIGITRTTRTFQVVELAHLLRGWLAWCRPVVNLTFIRFLNE